MIMMNRLDIIRTRVYQGKSAKFSSAEDWLEDENTPFFLLPNCDPFEFLNLSKLSALLGINVTSYVFRKFVSTWALAHKSREINKAEPLTLAHSLPVAEERYQLNKQVLPQLLTQTYIREEGFYPIKLKTQLNLERNELDKMVKEKQELRVRKRYQNLLAVRERARNAQLNSRPLGPHNRILAGNRDKFIKTVEKQFGQPVESILKDLKPDEWHASVVRLVCSLEGEDGEALRDLWVEIYKG